MTDPQFLFADRDHRRDIATQFTDLPLQFSGIGLVPPGEENANDQRPLLVDPAPEKRSVHFVQRKSINRHRRNISPRPVLQFLSQIIEDLRQVLQLLRNIDFHTFHRPGMDRNLRHSPGLLSTHRFSPERPALTQTREKPPPSPPGCEARPATPVLPEPGPEFSHRRKVSGIVAFTVPQTNRRMYRDD